MPGWPSKDPSAVLDYLYRIPLEPGDSVAGQPTVEVIAGSVVKDSQEPVAPPNTTEKGYGQDLTVWISGGEAGETAVLRITWTTTDGRTPDPAIITLPVVETDLEPLLLTGYAKPSAGHLQIRYPSFSSVPASTIQFWLTDAERSVDQSWSEGDYAAALMALAAHNMALAGLGTEGAALAGVPAGVSRFKSGTLDVTLTEAAANARSTGSFASTRYGQEYQTLLRRNRGGPLVTASGIAPMDPWVRYPDGQA